MDEENGFRTIEIVNIVRQAHVVTRVRVFDGTASRVGQELRDLDLQSAFTHNVLVVRLGLFIYDEIVWVLAWVNDLYLVEL